jgi:elongation factor G
MMRTYGTEAIRNVALVSHSGTGKTTLAESLLFRTGAITRQGRVEDGNTVSDYEQEEVKRRHSVHMTVLPVEWRDTKINLLDTPGYLDFAGEAVSALRVADAALLLVDAASGMEVGTDLMLQQAEKLGLPRFILINKIDRENANFMRTFEGLRARLGTACAPLFMPVGAEKSFRGVIDLLHRKALIDGKEAAVPPDLQAEADMMRDKLVEAIADTDEDLQLKYLESAEISDEELVAALHKGVRSGQVIPVMAGSALHPDMAPLVLDALVELAPSPAERPAAQASVAKGGTVELTPDPNGPLAAFVFKTSADPFVGKLSYFRVYSGTLQPDAPVWNCSAWQQEKMGHLFTMRGKQQERIERLMPGDIGASSKLGVTLTGHTISSREDGIALQGLEFPTPVYSVALHAVGKNDEDKMGSALARLAEEDPSLHVMRDPETGETVLSGLGDAHVEVALEVMKRKFGVDLAADVPRVPYRETIATPVRAEYKHKKQSGGHGQYGHVVLGLEPRERGAGFEFDVKVVGGAVPKNYYPAVEKGVREAMDHGVLAGYPVVDVRVVLYDGSSHAVDSSEMAFKIAAATAFRHGLEQGRSVLLEPIVSVDIRTTDEHTGDIIGDLNTRRARVLGMLPQDGLTTIQAEAPLSEMLRYAPALRSMTQGRGTFTMRHLRYDVAPEHIAQKIEAASRQPARAMG